MRIDITAGVTASPFNYSYSGTLGDDPNFRIEARNSDGSYTYDDTVQVKRSQDGGTFTITGETDGNGKFLYDYRFILYPDANSALPYALNSSKLFSTDSGYSYGTSNPYYGYLTYNSAAGRWRFKVSPATPEGVEVAFADNAGALNGQSNSVAVAPNTIVQRDANGYIQNNYFYTSGGGAERNNGGIGYIAGFNSSDYYIRSYTPAALAAAMGLDKSLIMRSLPETTASYPNANDYWATGGLMGFMYQGNNAPTTGTIMSVAGNFGGGGYSLQMQGGYGDNRLFWRNRNGDNGSWNGWREVVYNGYDQAMVTFGGGNGPGYSAANLQLYRNNSAGQGAPVLSFHYGGIVASTVTIESTGRIAIKNNPGTGYESFIANNIQAVGNLVVSGQTDAYGWIYSHGGYGIYNAAYSTGIFSKNIYGYTIYTDAQSSNVQLQFCVGSSTNIVGYVYGDSGNNFGLLNSGGGWSLRMNGNDALISGSATATRFLTGYDSGVANSMNCNGWFRSGGQSGWYSADYGGGIWMQDTTWVRVYNNKAFLVQNTMQAERVCAASGGFKSYSDKGMIGNYDSQGNTPMIIWTIGDIWNSLGGMYGLAYGYASYWGSHSIDIRQAGVLNVSLGMDGYIWARNYMRSPIIHAQSQLLIPGTDNGAWSLYVEA